MWSWVCGLKKKRRKTRGKQALNHNSIRKIGVEKDYIFLRLEDVERVLLKKGFDQVRFLCHKGRTTPLACFWLRRLEGEVESNTKEVLMTLDEHFTLVKLA